MHAQAVSNATAKSDLAGFAVPRGIGREGTGHLMALSSVQKKARGETLFAEGDAADSVYEVVRGTVRLCKLLPDGRRLITGFLSDGQLLGLASEGVRVST